MRSAFGNVLRPERADRFESAEDMLNRLKDFARTMKREVISLYFASRDPETPITAKTVAWLVAAYALSPIDLIPDFIPVLGYLDDLILIPLGIKLALSLVPPSVMERARLQADKLAGRPKSSAGLLIVISIWLALLGAVGLVFLRSRL